MKKRLYIAYGSNLNIAQMKRRCPTAKLVGVSEIKDYELVFRGVATIEKKKESRVPVGVWEIEENDEKALDLYEGYPRFYKKEDFNIDLDGEKIEAMAYVMTPGHRLGMPSDYYFNVIYQGYKDNGLDINVLNEAVKETARKIEEEKEEIFMQWRWW